MWFSGTSWVGIKLGVIICLKRCQIHWCCWFLFLLTTWLAENYMYTLYWGNRSSVVNLTSEASMHVYTHRHSQIAMWSFSWKMGDLEMNFHSFYSKWHTLPHTILYIKWTMESYFPEQTEMMFFEVGSCISKPEICMEDICAVPSGQVFN